MLNHIILSMFLVNSLVGWSVLSDVSFKLEYYEQFGQEIEIPVFGERLKAQEGRSFTVSGYFVPAEMEGNSIILSKLPYASCFFCGGAGIESVIEVQFADEHRRFDLDEIVTVRGTLVLNDDDFEHLIFILKDAREVQS